MTCVLTDRESRGYKWSCKCDEHSIKRFAGRHDITKLVLAACIEKKVDAIQAVLEFAKARGLEFDINRLFCIEGGPSLFGEDTHYSDGIVTPIFALLMGILTMREYDEDPQITRCLKLLLEHSANPYIKCRVAENCFPIEISKFELDVRGLLRLCRMFQVGSPTAAEELEIVLDAFEMKLGIQDL